MPSLLQKHKKLIQQPCIAQFMHLLNLFSRIQGLGDATGELTAMFYGRTHIPGVEPGARLRLKGKVSIREDGPVMINPAYQLVAKESD